uniref:Reverse transcriptase domain-containing protein n=1 Tax=Ananas comosus var. bracteatus TaxID=296719 RepID=A0A6V7QH48_ANACO|nr:unnamed protein product [Ananas comosus var. bracteatus]
MANHLYSFFRNQLGVEHIGRPTISLPSIFGRADCDLFNLELPFSEEEMKQAVFATAPEKASGPDDFPTLFFQRFWSTIKADVMRVFNSFYNGTGNLEGINSSWTCLIPKKSGAAMVRDYRPISLVNSITKLLSKVLATRLQSHMDHLINPFQAAFIRGRHILDNFFATHILTHHLHSTKQQAALLKLDFERAFDQISWDFLLNLLHVRGFGNRWINWVSSLLHSATTAVLLNGVLERPFPCKRGLRQGDPLSLLLFNLCVDVLFRMLQLAFASNSLPSVGIGDCKFHTLQFVDDLLLFFDGTCRSAAAIRIILDAFSEYSGLKINFNKSSIIPINLASSETSSLARFFGCSLQNFPLNYLGLPLSPRACEKLTTSL